MPDNTALMDIRSVNTLAEFMGIGDLFMKSGVFSDVKSAAQAATKIIAGREMGLGPFASMNSLYMVKGKIAMSGNLIASKIKASGKYDYKVIEKTNDKCVIEFFQLQPHSMEMASIGKETFTMDDARAAGLAGGENWRKWPKNMLFNRCVSNGYRTYCPDIFSMGPVYTPEELEPAVRLDEEGTVIDVAVTELKPDTTTTLPPVDGTNSISSNVPIEGAVMTNVHNYEEEPWANPEMNPTDARDILYAQAVAEWNYSDIEAIRKHVKEHPLWDGRRLQTIDDIIFVASLLKPQALEAEPE